MDFRAKSQRGSRRRLRLLRFAVPLGVAAVLTLMLAGVASGIGVDARVSTGSGGTQANSYSDNPAISADGFYVAFDSFASNLVNADNNAKNDVFLKNVITGTTTRVSTAADGTEGNDYSYHPAVSSNGRYVTFYSAASNLLGANNDLNGSNDVFVKDTWSGAITRVSVRTDGTEGGSGYSTFPDISADGRYVAFQSTANNLVADDTGKIDIFVRDTVSNTTSRSSTSSAGAQANDDSYAPAISADGRYVVFYSTATDLVASDTGGYTDIFIKDRQSSVTKKVSVANGTSDTGANGHCYAADISADGRYVVFYSNASNLDDTADGNSLNDVFIRDTQTLETDRVSSVPGGRIAR